MNKNNPRKNWDIFWDNSNWNNSLKTLNFLNKSKIIDTILNNNIIDIIKNMEFEEFKIFLLRINWLVKWDKIKDRRFRKHAATLSAISKVNYNHWFFQIEESLKILFESAKKISDKYCIAKLVYLWILFIHPFLDWNWRTSRVLYSLISWWLQKKEDIEKELIAYSSSWKSARERIWYFVDIEKIVVEIEGKMLYQEFWMNPKWKRWIEIRWINEFFHSSFRDKNLNDDQKRVRDTMVTRWREWFTVIKLALFKVCFENREIANDVYIESGYIVLDINQWNIKQEHLSLIVNKIKEMEIRYLQILIDIYSNIIWKNSP